MDEGGQPRKFPKTWLIVGAILLLFFMFGSTAARLMTESLWFTHDAQHPEVFAKRLWTTVGLGTVGFIVSLIAIGFSARFAVRTPIIYDSSKSGPQVAAALSGLRVLESAGTKIAWAVAAFTAYVVGSAFSGQAENYWMFQASQPFGKVDPIFGMDLGFHVFRLPFIEGVVGLALAVSLVTLVMTGLIYLGLRSLSMVAGAQLRESSMTRHLSFLAGITLLLIAVRLYVGRFSAGTMESGQFTGPGYAGSQALGLMLVVSIIVALTGLIALAYPWLNRKLREAPYMLAAPLAISVVALLVYPPIIQRLKVDPNRLTIESPYAKRGIEATRYAYRLGGTEGDGVTIRDFAVQAEPTTEEVIAAESTIKNMRLWDPDVMQVAVNGLQSLRPYYEFNDVDIDRYEVDGEQRMVMLSARNIHVAGLSANARNWLTQKLQYTHGFGLVMAPVNEALNTGRPNFWIRNLPPAASQGFKVDQPRIYFSDYAPGSEEREGYLLLKSDVEEFDYPAQTDQKTRWEGKRGVPVGSYFNKLLYSYHFGDGNLLVSPNIKPGTQILYRRDIKDRAAAIYPFLRFDVDPYITLVDGKLSWILDAYTTTDRIPYSAVTVGPLGKLNYLRNSVKIVTNAYDGEMTAYAADATDPILKMIQKAFPGLIKPEGDLPESLRAHIRYGEDFFLHQAAAMTQYHVTDPVTFLNNEDAWEIPTEIGREGQTELIKPYYVQIRLPGESRDAFMLILPFTPRGKANMIGWMAAHCDPEQYGQVLLYKFPKDAQTQGPNQMESTFNSDPTVADLNRQLNNDQSRIVPGNMLVIPIGSSILYVKPLFLQARSTGIQPIPELKKVVLGLQNRVVVADTYAEAIEKLFGQRAAAPATTETGPPTTVPSTPPSKGELPMTELRAIGKMLDEADAALRQGDFAKYGELQRQARQRLKALENKP